MQATERRGVTSFYLIGRLLEEPEKSVSANGRNVIKFKVASLYSGKDNDTPEVFELVGFNNLAQEEYEKGSTMLFQGKLQANNYTKDSNTYYRTNLLVNSISTVA